MFNKELYIHVNNKCIQFTKTENDSNNIHRCMDKQMKYSLHRILFSNKNEY